MVRNGIFWTIGEQLYIIDYPIQLYSMYYLIANVLLLHIFHISDGDLCGTEHIL